MINKNLANSHIRQKSNYDRFVKQRVQYEIGDTVKIINYRARPGKSAAFEPKFLGPYVITRTIGDSNFKLEADNREPEIVHYNRMSPYNVRVTNVSNGTECLNNIEETVNKAEENDSSELIDGSNINLLNLLIQRSNRRKRNKVTIQQVRTQPEITQEQVNRLVSYLPTLPIRTIPNTDQIAALNNLQFPFTINTGDTGDRIITFQTRITRAIVRHFVANNDNTFEENLNRSTHTNELDTEQHVEQLNNLINQDDSIRERNILNNSINLNINNTDDNGETDHARMARAVEQPTLVQQQIQYTDKGKPKSKCPNCEGHYEIVTGLRIHALTCKGINK